MPTETHSLRASLLALAQRAAAELLPLEETWARPMPAAAMLKRRTSRKRRGE